MNESKLIAAAQRGDVSAFNRLVLSYEDTVYHTVYRVLGQHTAAARTTEAIFLSAYQALRSFRGGLFKLWLFRLVIRVCCQPRDTNDRRIRPAMGIIAADENALSLDAILEMGLACLPLEERMTVILSDLQGFTYDEIADITETTRASVQSRLTQARDRLRRFLLAQPELIPTDDRLNCGTTSGGD